MTILFLAMLSFEVWAQSPNSDGEGGDKTPSESTSETSSDSDSPIPSDKDGRPEEVESLIKSGVFIGSTPNKDVEKTDSETQTDGSKSESEPSKNKSEQLIDPNSEGGSKEGTVKKGPPNPVKGGELIIQYEDEKSYAAEKVWLKENLQRYLKASETVVIAEVLDQRPMRSNSGKDIEIDVKISEYLRGSGLQMRSFVVPFNAPYVVGQPETIPPVIVVSYKMLIFVDKYGSVLDGNAMFVVDGKFAWRNKRPNIFLHPRHDRNWDLAAPIEDYTMYDIAEVRKQVDTYNNRPWHKRCFFD